jgi:hypothetical protein
VYIFSILAFALLVVVSLLLSVVVVVLLFVVVVFLLIVVLLSEELRTTLPLEVSVGDFDGVFISVLDLPLLIVCVSEVVLEVVLFGVPQAVSNVKKAAANNIFKFFIVFVFDNFPNLQITVVMGIAFKKILWISGLGC